MGITISRKTFAFWFQNSGIALLKSFVFLDIRDTYLRTSSSPYW